MHGNSVNLNLKEGSKHEEDRTKKENGIYLSPSLRWLIFVSNAHSLIMDESAEEGRYINTQKI